MNFIVGKLLPIRKAETAKLFAESHSMCSQETSIVNLPCLAKEKICT